MAMDAATLQGAQRDPARPTSATAPATAPAPQGAMTVDVEDYFQVAAFSEQFPIERWADVPLRVEANVDRLLALFDEHDTRATFFTLGWVAARLPTMVQRIVAEGHELASHGQQHVKVHTQDRAAFLEDARGARELLEDIGGCAVTGYRAASFSMGPETPWAHGVLREAGYRYSSSVYPVAHDHYGVPDAPRFMHDQDGIIEVPPTTLRRLGRNWPVSGGGWFRLYPYSVNRWALDRVAAEGERLVFYFHPWEIDAAQPRVADAPGLSRFRHYLNLERFEARLRRLLTDFRWGTMQAAFIDDAALLAGAGDRGEQPA